jgi:hypothetical protein
MYRNCGGALGLDEKRPVIWAYHKIAHISVEEGVYRLGADFAEAKYKSVVWTLVDSDNGFINDFTQHNILFFVIYATSPAAERWKHLTKTVSETVSVQFVVTNPWAQSEIHQAYVMSLEFTYTCQAHAIPIFAARDCTSVVQLLRSSTIHMTDSAPTPRLCLDTAFTTSGGLDR